MTAGRTRSQAAVVEVEVRVWPTHATSSAGGLRRASWLNLLVATGWERISRTGCAAAPRRNRPPGPRIAAQ
jgi:hypothetical protein